MNNKAGATSIKQETKSELKPRLRFPEFRDAEEWEEKKLKRLAKRITLKNVEGKETRVLTNSAEYGVVNQRDYFDKDIANKGNLDGYFIVEQGDYVYNPRISTIAPVGPISKNNIGTGVMSPLYTVFRFKNSNNTFYEHYFKSTQWHQYLRQVSNSGARHDRMSITNDDFMDMPLPAPPPEEQQKIADCLSSIDELITAQAQKLDALKAHKKGLMQQLFPAEGETLPRLRFPEFRDAPEWGNKKLGKVLIEQPRQIKMDDEKEYSLVTVKRRYGGVVFRGIFKGKSIIVKSQFLLQENDFLISKRQIVHCACGVVPKVLEGSIVSNEYSVLRVRDGFDISFVDYFSQQPKVSQSFLDCSIGIVIEKMLFKLNDWLRQEFLFPSLLEQQRIAACLSSIDELIAAQAQKLDALKDHKKGLMQQLFPSLDEVKE
jgi:type I restriction enzyme S subunit